MTGKLFNISGKGKYKTLRFYKGMLPILKWVHEDALSFYMESFYGHKYPGGKAHIERNHRMAEAVCMFMRAGVEVVAYRLPKLQNEHLFDVIGEKTVFYDSKSLKRAGDEQINKTMFSRIVGTLFAGGQCYAVYNTRDAVMKWNGLGEFKTLYSLIEIARSNSHINGIDSAVLFGASEETALQSLIESDRSRRLEFRFDSVYRHIHFVPLGEMGMRFIRILCLSDWREMLLELLFDKECRSFDLGEFEYDAKVGGVYVLSFLDFDIARLVRYRDAIQNRTGAYEILCYPQQAAFLHKFIGEAARLKTIEMKTIEAALGLK